MNFLRISFFVLLSILSVLPAYAEEGRGTKEEAIAMCDRVKADFEAQGLEALKGFITEEKKYNTKDLYPFLYDVDGNVVAHGLKPNMVGMNRIDARDKLVDGKAYVKEFVDLAKSGKSGWVDYVFIDPVTKKPADKSSYILPLTEKYFVGVGVYKPAD